MNQNLELDIGECDINNGRVIELIHKISEMWLYVDSNIKITYQVYRCHRHHITEDSELHFNNAFILSKSVYSAI